MMNPVRIVLVEPLSAGNVGAVCRAMKTMGLSRLVLVRPHGDPKSLEAVKMAAHARDLLKRATVVGTLDAAIAPAHIVVGTSRREGRHRRSMLDPRGLADRVAKLPKDRRVAILFGREDRGLTNAELARCQWRVRIHSNPRAPSLNVAQAVQIVAYEMYLARSIPLVKGGHDSPLPFVRGGLEWGRSRNLPPPSPSPSTALRAGLQRRGGARAAPASVLEPMYAHLEEALQAIGFLDPANPLRGMRIARGIFGRAGMTKGEAAFIRGICRQILWVAGRIM